MASGATHDTLAKYTMLPSSLVVGSVVYYFSNDIQYSMECGVLFYLSQQVNRLSTPDSDVDGLSYQDYLTKTIDPYFSKVWYYIFIIYSLLPHRHWISHTIIVSGVLRLLYIALFFSPIIFYFRLFDQLIYYWDYSLIFIGGYCLGDLLHIILDYVLPIRRFVERIVQ